MFKQILPLILIIVILLSSCNYNNDKIFWDNIENKSSLYNESSNVAPDTHIKEQSKQKNTIEKLNWNQAFRAEYNRSLYPIAEVVSEYSITGENWFPSVNNTVALDSVAPVIGYDTALDLYLRYPFYPDTPEYYTVEYLNEHCFPINFMRKYNEQLYYTACRVENEGYLFFFFCAADNLDITARELAEEEIKLYGEYSAQNRDMTKELVWRGCVYLSEDGLDTNELARELQIGIHKPLSVYAEKYPEIKFVNDALDRQLITRVSQELSAQEKLESLNFQTESNSYNIFCFALPGEDEFSLITIKISCLVDENENYYWVLRGIQHGGMIVHADGSRDFTERNSWPCALLEIDR